MKTLHVTNRLYPEFNGGTEIHVFELCQTLSRKGIKTVIFTQETGDYKKIGEKIILFDGVKKYILLLPLLSSKIKFLETFFLKEFRLLKYFIQTLDLEKPEIVHFHHLIDLSPWLLWICRLYHIPVCLDLVDYWFICPDIYLTCDGDLKKCATMCLWNRPRSITDVLIARINRSWLTTGYGYLKVIFHRLFWKFQLNNSGVILMPISARTGQIYRDHGVTARMVVKPCGIKAGNKLPHHQTSKKPTIGFVGTLIPAKGVRTLIKAFRSLKNKNINLNLYGVNGFKAGELTKMIANDSRIVLKGQFDHSDLTKIYFSIDLLVVPSLWEETFGIVVSEGQAAGIPVIVSSIGGMAERITDGVNGFLVKPGNATELAAKIGYVLTHYRQIKLALRPTGIFTLTKESNQLMEIYHDLLAVNRLPNYLYSQIKRSWVLIR